MNEKLTYEEWRGKHYGTIIISPEAVKSLQKYHNVDADEEIESMIRREYNFYINDGVEE